MRIEFNLDGCEECTIRAEIVGDEVWLTKIEQKYKGFTSKELEFVMKILKVINEH